MAKSVHDDVLDGALTVLKTAANKMTVCSAQPTTYAEANATLALAAAAMTAGDYAIANGDVSGRKVTVGQKTGVPVTATGTATHVALLDTATSRLLYVTTCTSQVLTSGNTMTANAWDVEIADPA